MVAAVEMADETLVGEVEMEPMLRPARAPPSDRNSHLLAAADGFVHRGDFMA